MKMCRREKRGSNFARKSRVVDCSKNFEPVVFPAAVVSLLHIGRGFLQFALASIIGQADSPLIKSGGALEHRSPSRALHRRLCVPLNFFGQDCSATLLLSI